MPKNLCPIIRGRIIGQWEAGKPIANIAIDLKCSEKTVRKWINRFVESGINALHDHRIHNRRPRKTTKQQDEDIIVSVQQQPFRTVAEIITASGVQVSNRTARRRLKEAGYHSYRLVQETPKRRQKSKAHVCKSKRQSDDEEEEEEEVEDHDLN